MEDYAKPTLDDSSPRVGIRGGEATRQYFRSRKEKEKSIAAKRGPGKKQFDLGLRV